jgi:hypothetical protein
MTFLVKIQKKKDAIQLSRYYNTKCESIVDLDIEKEESPEVAIEGYRINGIKTLDEILEEYNSKDKSSFNLLKTNKTQVMVEYFGKTYIIENEKTIAEMVITKK